MSQQNIPIKSFLLPVLVFIVITGSVILLKDRLEDWQVDRNLLLYGNLLLFCVTLFSWLFHRKALQAGNTQAFLRNVYSAMLMKLFVCIVAFFIYAFYKGADINKPALFSVMFLYLLYTFLELSVLLKYSKQKNNA